MRHAHVHNPRNILYGRLPRFRLSEDGARQAEAVARFLSTRTLAGLYSSPLLRARQTAQAISSYHPDLVIRFSRLLLETRSGFEGESNDILKPGFSFYEPRRHPTDETMEDVWRRMIRMVKRAVSRHPGGSVVLVSHADPITILRVGLEGRAFTTRDLHAVVYPDRASVTQLVIGVDGETSLSYYNVGESRDKPPAWDLSRSESA